ncbi:hypothetical protein [Obesumbacterium proteus]|uniref:hypothetical protein n=2 Tax=Hafniaceae TaxID=1903412 RepID=UPI001F34BF16|nr:hypothetical protein [Obesumbacterium proteus]MCE9884197.1 hypothetical protein [Obesumbacterium proteus]MCE9916679.1 hypothetical protein [Obesumbacterium proteus]MCE9930697.1 hypothetical protein [Obesumbacterium proteus]MCG2876691.1 hypothetical protein [Obesumbacterium proteus]
MSMIIINNKPSITEMQLHAMLTGDVKGATQLDGWDAFKNFFIKLLNHLPGISLVDKEVALHGIYNQIYGTESPSGFDEKTKSIEPVWNALDKLIHMMEKDKVQTMTFGIQRSDAPHSEQCEYPLPEIRVKITIDGHSLADILCATTPLNNNMLNSIIENYMAEKIGDSEDSFCKTYELNPDIFSNAEDNTFSFNSTARTANDYGFNVAKEIDKCHSFLATPLYDNIKSETCFTDEVEQLNCNQQLVSALNKLKFDGGESIAWNNTLIETTIAKLEQYREAQQASYQALNSNFVELLVQKWITKLEQSKPLLKAEISEDINRITTIDSRSLDLFKESDRTRLDQLPKQLRVVYQIVDLESSMSSSTESPQAYHHALKNILKNTEAGPLKEALMAQEKMAAEHINKTEEQLNNLQLLAQKIDSWAKQINSKPMTGQNPEASTSNAVPNQSEPTITLQLASLKNETSQQNLTQEHKNLLLDKIEKLIIQHETIKTIENKLNSYESQNTKATNEDLKVLVDEKESLTACPRRNDIDQRISVLIAKKVQFDDISLSLASVRNGIASVNKNLAVYSDKLKDRLAEIEKRANALPLAEDDKKPILTNIAAAKQELAKIQQQDEVYTQVRTLLSPETPSTTTPSANWHMALSQLNLAAAHLKTLPDSPRKLQLTKDFSEDVKSALIMLAGFCTQSPTGPEKTDYMKDREKDYILLRDLVRSNKLPNNTELEENITLIKSENKFKSTPLMQKIFG